MSPTEIEISLKMIQDLRDNMVSGGDNEYAWFTIAVGLAERMERMLELLESVDDQLTTMALD